MKPGTPPPILSHYTCDHALDGIVADQQVVPNPQPWLGVALVWLTDLDVPDRAGLGLTAAHLSCDRTVNRVDVARTTVMQPWVKWARNHDVPALVRDIIAGGGALPMHWWVSPVAVQFLAVHRARRHIGRVCA